MSKTLSPNVMNILAKYMVRPKAFQVFIIGERYKSDKISCSELNYMLYDGTSHINFSSDKKVKQIQKYSGNIFFTYHKHITNSEAKSFDNRVHAIL